MRIHWIEQMDHRHELVRVAVKEGKPPARLPSYVARVVPHRDAWWRIELREEGVASTFRGAPRGKMWVPLRGKPSGKYQHRRTRMFRSPEAAMAVVEGLDL